MDLTLKLIIPVTSLIKCWIIDLLGTSVTFKPGVMLGGSIQHDCPNSRAIGYFLEPLIALAPFGKHPLQLTLNGITNDNIDVSVCIKIYITHSNDAYD